MRSRYAIINNRLYRIDTKQQEETLREVYGSFRSLLASTDKIDNWYFFFNPEFDLYGEPETDMNDDPTKCFICFSPECAKSIEDTCKVEVGKIKYEYLCEISAKLHEIADIVEKIHEDINSKEDNKNE